MAENNQAAIDEDFVFEDDCDPGDECGRWSNGKLGRLCSLAGTEFCDFECPYRAEPPPEG